MSEVEATQAPIVLADLGKEALRDLLGNLTQAKAFVLEQAPEFCQQLLARDMGLALFGSICCLIAAIAGTCLFRRCVNGLKNDDGNPGWIMGSVFSAMGSLAALAGVVYWLFQFLYIHLAPKVYLVEQLMKMVK
jgi:hypothetical protein